MLWIKVHLLISFSLPFHPKQQTDERDMVTDGNATSTSGDWTRPAGRGSLQVSFLCGEAGNDGVGFSRGEYLCEATLETTARPNREDSTVTDYISLPYYLTYYERSPTARNEISRFLQKNTFGPTKDDLDRLEARYVRLRGEGYVHPPHEWEELTPGNVEPSTEPSTSAGPSSTANPSVRPSNVPSMSSVPSISSRPTTSAAPYVPSSVPSRSSGPTEVPSKSSGPTASQGPSNSPSASAGPTASGVPSAEASAFPSAAFIFNGQGPTGPSGRRLSELWDPWSFKRYLQNELEGPNATGTNVTDANVTNTNMTDTNVTDTNVTDTNVTDTNMTDTNVTNTNMTDTNATEANVTNVTDLNLNLGPPLTHSQAMSALRLEWVAEQTNASTFASGRFTSLRRYWRSRLNARKQETYRIGESGPHPCEKHARWRKFAFTALDAQNAEALRWGSSDLGGAVQRQVSDFHASERGRLQIRVLDFPFSSTKRCILTPLNVRWVTASPLRGWSTMAPRCRGTAPLNPRPPLRCPSHPP